MVATGSMFTASATRREGNLGYQGSANILGGWSEEKQPTKDTGVSRPQEHGREVSEQSGERHSSKEESGPLCQVS